MRCFLWRSVVLGAGVFAALGAAHADQVTFTSQELFRIPFGDQHEALGSRIEGGQVLIPHDFTMDLGGHFYIYDANKHRIARYSFEGKYEMGWNYPVTAQQVFAHADSHQNLWLLISDPVRGLYYGVYGPDGKSLRSGIFSHYDQFRLHVDDEGTLHVLLSSKKDPGLVQTYLWDEEKQLMKKENVARPPEDHHQVRKSSQVYFLDKEPTSSSAESPAVTRVSDAAHNSVAEIQGDVIYITDDGDVYTRVGERELKVYAVDGRLKGTVHLAGLPSACQNLRFDSQGTMYELDGIPDADGHYSGAMTGMRMLQWRRAP